MSTAPGSGGQSSLHLVEVHVAAVDRHLLTVEEPAQGGEVLLEQRHRRGHPAADLPHPVLHAVTDARDEPAGEDAVQGGHLHGCQRHVAQRRGHQPDPDPDLLRGAQGGRGARDPALLEAVLPDPEVVEVLVGGSGQGQQRLGRQAGDEHNAESGCHHDIVAPTPDSHLG